MVSSHTLSGEHLPKFLGILSKVMHLPCQLCLTSHPHRFPICQGKRRHLLQVLLYGFLVSL